jgi:hypothetical protein
MLHLVGYILEQCINYLFYSHTDNPSPLQNLNINWMISDFDTTEKLKNRPAYLGLIV